MDLHQKLAVSFLTHSLITKFKKNLLTGLIEISKKLTNKWEVNISGAGVKVQSTTAMVLGLTPC